MIRLQQHPNPIDTLFPAVETVMKYVDVVDASQGSHWFMRNGANRRHSLKGQALIKLNIKPSPKMGYRTSGEYSVARLIIMDRLKSVPFRTSFTCECRLPQCVNPDHWKAHFIRYPYVFMRTTYYWALANARTLKPVKGVVPVRARTRDSVVHAFNVPLNFDERLISACGGTFPVHDLVLVSAPVTCMKGC